MHRAFLKLVRALASVLAAVALLAGRAQAAADAKEVHSMVDMVRSADGIRIAYELRGEGSPALVFVHGWSCDRSYWVNQLPPFA